MPFQAALLPVSTAPCQHHSQSSLLIWGCGAGLAIPGVRRGAEERSRGFVRRVPKGLRIHDTAALHGHLQHACPSWLVGSPCSPARNLPPE